MTTIPPQKPTLTPNWVGIDPGLGTVATRVPAASRENSRPQAILKFQRPSSLDYRARHGLLANETNVIKVDYFRGIFMHSSSSSFL